MCAVYVGYRNATHHNVNNIGKIFAQDGKHFQFPHIMWVVHMIHSRDVDCDTYSMFGCKKYTPFFEFYYIFLGLKVTDQNHSQYCNGLARSVCCSNIFGE